MLNSGKFSIAFVLASTSCLVSFFPSNANQASVQLTGVEQTGRSVSPNGKVGEKQNKPIVKSGQETSRAGEIKLVGNSLLVSGDAVSLKAVQRDPASRPVIARQSVSASNNKSAPSVQQVGELVSPIGSFGK